MSSHDRLIILSMVLVAAVAVAGSSVLLRGPAPGPVAGAGWRPINAQRADLQLTYNTDVTRNMPADMALLYASLGSFRGLAINYLWMRATELKEEGKFYEAMELSRMITKLNPRFAQVWVFHSWNMAFNISVATHTERERWMWVKAGIDLLRDEGIPANPKSTGLYKQLSWTYLFKIGGFTDDMHWYYKRQLAGHWHELLGAPPAGETDRVVRWFEPIAEMDERFFRTDAVPVEVHEGIGALLVEYDGTEVEERLERLRFVTAEQFERRADEVIAGIDDRRADLIERLQRLREVNAAALDRSAREPDELFLEAYPEAAERVRWLRNMGLRLDGELARRLGRLDTAPVTAEQPADEAERVDAALAAWLAESGEQPARVRDAVLRPYLRAKALRVDEHMSASIMHELMRGAWLATGRAPQAAAMPIDWRHPAAHALYWAVRGVRAGVTRRNISDRERIVMLNTDRQVLHAIQLLTHNGYVVFDPRADYYEQLPDPRYIEAYELAAFGVGERVEGEYENAAVLESFEAGHENFLIWATRLTHHWGERRRAEALYDRLGRLYGDKPGRADKYAQPLDEFAFAEVRQTIISPDDARQVIGGLVQQAIMQGYLNNRPDVAARRLTDARRLHAYYQSEQGRQTLHASKARMAMPAFGEFVTNITARFMLVEPDRISIDAKRTVWQALGRENPSLQRAVWERVGERLYEQVRRAMPQGPDPAALFPEPSSRNADGQP